MGCKLGLAVVLLAVAMGAGAAGFTPAATCRFADLKTIAASVASLAKGRADPLLTGSIPAGIRNQRAVRLFGPMRKGCDAVAVCFVDAAALARLTSSKAKKSAMAFDGAKLWTLFYPASVSRTTFLKTHAQYARLGKDGIVTVQGSGQRALYAYWTANEQWVALGPSPALAKYTPIPGAAALAKPRGNNLAVIRMDANGARALFGATACTGGMVAIKLTPSGLELTGWVTRPDTPAPVLKPGALAFPGVPATAAMFGATSVAGDLRSADVFSLLGVEAGVAVKQSVAYLKTPAAGASLYYINAVPAKPGQRVAPVSPYPPAQRFANILPEARGRNDLDGVMFCSAVAVYKACLPRLARTLSPGDEMAARAGARLLRASNGTGVGFMSWREGSTDRYFCRISNDELRATAALWGDLFVE